MQALRAPGLGRTQQWRRGDIIAGQEHGQVPQAGLGGQALNCFHCLDSSGIVAIDRRTELAYQVAMAILGIENRFPTKQRRDFARDQNPERQAMSRC
jgi:hypothetical protein